ncbi:MAG: rRNA maturation RNase YbeY [Gammaproteobacteria bacterium]|nr:rRNA maturation RNase YbeY [Gammaproteobacteria bacterium]
MNKASSVLQVDVEIVSIAKDIPDATLLTAWAQAAYQDTVIADVAIRIVDEIEAAAINEQYRHKAYAPNVLSFPMQIPSDLELESRPLGDVVICAPVVQREALEQKKALTAHWAHMVVHGLLHLQGYDHEEATDADEMENLECQVLAACGFANPYVETE